jgi:hypothetical protein
MDTPARHGARRAWLAAALALASVACSRPEHFSVAGVTEGAAGSAGAESEPGAGGGGAVSDGMPAVEAMDAALEPVGTADRNDAGALREDAGVPRQDVGALETSGPADGSGGSGPRGDAGDAGDGPPPGCAAGADCSCATSKTCTLGCVGAGCILRCGISGTCNFDCPGGDCTFVCNTSSKCQTTCAGGNCDLACGDSATCGLKCGGVDAGDVSCGGGRLVCGRAC